MGKASLPYIHTDWEMLGDGTACWAPMSQLYDGIYWQKLKL